MNFISLGAGVQSTVMLLMAECGEITPRPDAAIFADTGWEPAAIYRHLDWLEQQTDIPIIRVSAGNLRDDTYAGRRHDGKPGFLDIPHFIGEPGRSSLSKRQCTTNYKIRPIHRAARQLAGYPATGRAPPPGSICQWLGISTDEAHRMKDSRVQYIVNIYPLIDRCLSRADCQDWFAARYPGQPLHKSSCLGCPFHGDRTWLDIYRRGGTEWEDTVSIDERLRAADYPAHPINAEANGATSRVMYGDLYLHRRGPLATVIPALHRQLLMQPRLAGLEPDGYGNECEGHCGV